MFTQKNIIFLSVLFSILLVGQSFQAADAKKKKRSKSLSLAKTTINGSIFTASSNVLTIENASNLSATVTIKPTKKTLKNAKAITAEGTLEDGNLKIDLAKVFGAVNLAPGGDYIVKTKQGKRKLKAKFRFNPPTLVIGTLKVPEPDPTGEVSARILRRFQEAPPAGSDTEIAGEGGDTLPPVDPTVGDAPAPEATPDAPTALLVLNGPNQNPLVDESGNPLPPIEVAGDELLVGPDGTVYEDPTEAPDDAIPNQVYSYILEAPAGTEQGDEGFNPGEEPPFYVPSAEVNVVNAQGEPETYVLNGVSFPDDVSEANNVVPNADINIATTAAADVTTLETAALAEGASPEAIQDFVPHELYEACTEAAEPGNTATDPSQGFDLAQAGTQVGSTEILTAVNADLEDVPNIDEEVQGQAAATAAFNGPNAVGAPTETLLDPSQVPPDTFAIGLVDLEGSGVTLPPQVLANNAAEVIPGSLQIVGDNGEPLPPAEIQQTIIMQGSFPPPQVNGMNLGMTLNSIGSLLMASGMGNQIPIPPGVVFGGNAANDIGAEFPGAAEFPLAFHAGSIVGTEDLGIFAGGATAEEGAYMPPGIAGFIQPLPPGDHQPPPGFVPPFISSGAVAGASFMPPAFAAALAGTGAGIFNGSANIEDAAAHVFQMPEIMPGMGIGPLPPPPPPGFAEFNPNDAAALGAFQGAIAANANGFAQAAQNFAAAFGPQGGPPPELAGFNNFAMGGLNLPPPGSSGAGPISLGDFFGGGTPPADAPPGPPPGGFDFGAFTGEGGGFNPFAGGQPPPDAPPLPPPPVDGFQPPADAPPGGFPPPDGGTPPPDGFQPPADAPPGGFPPPDGGTQPPPGDGTQPPPGDGTQPPPGDGTQPPPDDGTQPPPDDGTQPPPDDGTQPPPDDGGGSEPAPAPDNGGGSEPAPAPDNGGGSEPAPAPDDGGGSEPAPPPPGDSSPPPPGGSSPPPPGGSSPPPPGGSSPPPPGGSSPPPPGGSPSP